MKEENSLIPNIRVRAKTIQDKRKYRGSPMVTNGLTIQMLSGTHQYPIFDKTFSQGVHIHEIELLGIDNLFLQNIVDGSKFNSKNKMKGTSW